MSHVLLAQVCEWWYYERENIMANGNSSCIPGFMWKGKLKDQYDKKALIDWNGLNVIGQNVKQVWTKPFICPSVNTTIIGPNVKVGDVKGPIWWRGIDWLKNHFCKFKLISNEKNHFKFNNFIGLKIMKWPSCT